MIMAICHDILSGVATKPSSEFMQDSVWSQSRQATLTKYDVTLVDEFRISSEYPVLSSERLCLKYVS